MEEILGGIAEWLHENGVKTDFDVTYEKWRRDSDLSLPSKNSWRYIKNPPSLVYLGIYSIDDKPIHFCWIDGSRLLMNGVFEIQQADSTKPYIVVGTQVQNSFELSDPGFLDDLLAKVRP